MLAIAYRLELLRQDFHRPLIARATVRHAPLLNSKQRVLLIDTFIKMIFFEAKPSRFKGTIIVRRGPTIVLEKQWSIRARSTNHRRHAKLKCDVRGWLCLVEVKGNLQVADLDSPEVALCQIRELLNLLFFSSSLQSLVGVVLTSYGWCAGYRNAISSSQYGATRRCWG